MNYNKYAPGWPGIEARWTSSAKSGVGTALNTTSEVWFTLSHGILNEIYYPRVDQACTRDMGFIITDGKDFFSEEKRHTKNKVEFLADGIPVYKLTNKCKSGYYEITKEILADPSRDCIIQKVKFEVKNNLFENPHIYALLAPHLGNYGSGNTAWVDDYKGTPMIFAQRGNTALAIACDVGWLNRSVGFAGRSDGWADLYENKKLTEVYERAENGNVALLGEIDLSEAHENTFHLIIGFGDSWGEAGQRARSTLNEGYESIQNKYIAEWRDWQKQIDTIKNESKGKKDLYKISAAVLRIHEAKRQPGGLIASLSIPWGFAKSDDDLGGYHLVWPRDLVESAGGLLALKSGEDAIRVIDYLQSTQNSDGHWAQNMWLDGTPYWHGIQMDETAFPILLVDLALRSGAIDKAKAKRYWPMIKSAASYIVANGPVTQQDRWEEDPGFSPFTLAVEISALLIAADFAKMMDANDLGKYMESTADFWNENIERWTYVTETDWANEIGVEGYYVRIAPPDQAEATSLKDGFVPIKNRPPGQDQTTESHLVSPDAIALVRFGLRKHDDEKILNTIKVIDEKLKVDTQFGPVWHRYNGDGWGEKIDGSAFDGTGIGRAWPLLTGERAHYEIIAGRMNNAKELKSSMEQFSNDGGMIPEQVWDADDIPEKELFFGRPAGSAMPLVWAHSEYIKLCRSINDKKVFDMPPQTHKRYIENNIQSKYFCWRFNNKCKTISRGKILRIECMANAKVRWTVNNWKSFKENETKDSNLGIFYLDLPANKLKKGDKIIFTFYWTEASKWEEKNYSIEIE